MHSDPLEPTRLELSARWQELDTEILLCRRCPRLVAWREQVAREKRRAYRDWEYWGRPVTGFGDHDARLLIVGLAPGAHGANRTGRVFTGDGSGDFLFWALFHAGFASQPDSIHRNDGLTLNDLYISAVALCAPPDNRPTTGEMDNCEPFLLAQMALLENLQGIVALGQVAFDRLLRIFRSRGLGLSGLKFAHGACYDLGDGFPWLLASYHPSRQNTQTGRLTPEMFDAIWFQARQRLV